MMRQSRYSPELKAKLVLEVLREDKTISQLASENEINPNMLRNWKSKATKNLHQLFTNSKKDITKLKNEHQTEVTKLYTKIGRLTTELNWLKKNLALTMDNANRRNLLDVKTSRKGD